MNVNWTEILSLMQLVVTAAKPEIKAMALAELKTAEAATTNQAVKALIEEAEAMVAAA